MKKFLLQHKQDTDIFRIKAAAYRRARQFRVPRRTRIRRPSVQSGDAWAQARTLGKVFGLRVIRNATGLSREYKRIS